MSDSPVDNEKKQSLTPLGTVEQHVEGQSHIFTARGDIHINHYAVANSNKATSSSGIGWRPPFAHTETFKGRNKDLEKLSKILGNSSTEAPIGRAILYGLPGVGKTSLAIEWCWLKRACVHSVLWIDASSKDTIDHDLAELASTLAATNHIRFDLKRAKETSDLVARAVAWLNSTHGWLLIADNCDSSASRDALRMRLKEGLPGCIIITSCMQDWPEAWAPIHLDVLSEENATEFLLNHSGQLLPPAPRYVENRHCS
jgi:hypothetical protein